MLRMVNGRTRTRARGASQMRARLGPGGGESGFLLLELVVVVVIIGILLSIGISYLNIRDRANRAVAYANVRTSVQAVETYYSDHDSYTGMTWAELDSIDQGLSPTLEVASVTAQSYCISDHSGDKTFHKEGPDGPLSEGGCA